MSDIALVEAEAMKLSEQDRAVLVDHLQASLSSKKITYLDEHIHEANERLTAYHSGDVIAVDGREFLSSLKTRLSGE